ncbi:MAG TPA: DUF3566 domain-containing protein [Actinomycetota bacterium]|nr:DUF3566 domain-containing protein [Actinomycetota bacterium]
MPSKEEPGYTTDPGSEAAAGGSGRTASMTQTRSRGATEPFSEEAPLTQTGARRVRPSARRARRILRRIDPVSVVKMSAFFYGVFLLVWMLFVAVVYKILDGAGLFDILHSVGAGMEIQELKNLDITLGLVEKWAFVAGFLAAAGATLVNGVLAVLYNLGAELIGGVGVTFVERDGGPPSE